MFQEYSLIAFFVASLKMITNAFFFPRHYKVYKSKYKKEPHVINGNTSSQVSARYIWNENLQTNQLQYYIPIIRFICGVVYCCLLRFDCYFLLFVNFTSTIKLFGIYINLSSFTNVSGKWGGKTVYCFSLPYNFVFICIIKSKTVCFFIRMVFTIDMKYKFTWMIEMNISCPLVCCFWWENFWWKLYEFICLRDILCFYSFLILKIIDMGLNEMCDFWLWKDVLVTNLKLNCVIKWRIGRVWNRAKINTDVYTTVRKFKKINV